MVGILELENLHQKIDEKKWNLAINEIQIYLNKSRTDLENTHLLKLFEKINLDIIEASAPELLIDFWKIAYQNGKIKNAKKYAEAIKSYLIKLKRIPALIQLQKDLLDSGLFKKNSEIENEIRFLLGTEICKNENAYYDLHPECLINNKYQMLDFLLNESEWKIRTWKLCYEYVLKHKVEKNLIEKIIENLAEEKQNKLLEKYNNLTKTHQAYTKLNIKKKNISQLNTNVENEKLDNLAYSVLEEKKEPSKSEQSKILVSIFEMTNEELKLSGLEMLVAFNFLGMDTVVEQLGKKLLLISTIPKDRSNILYNMAQAYLEAGRYYDVIDLCNDTIESEVLLSDETLAFEYMRAEGYLFLNKIDQALKIYKMIYGLNPNFRLIGERLKTLESIK
jgi:hypothetical protein